MAEIPEPVRRMQIEDSLRSYFDATIKGRVDRHLEVAHQGIIPNHHFAAASSECIRLYTDGYFLSAVMVTQAVAEGIRKFVVERNGIRIDDGNDNSKNDASSANAGAIRRALISAFHKVRGWFCRNLRKHKTGPDVVALLASKGIISEDCAKAFDRIWKSFRNDVHHMNPKVATIPFPELAKRNIDDLAVIEHEIFAFQVNDGTIRPLKPLYWDPPKPDGTTDVFLRLGP